MRQNATIKCRFVRVTRNPAEDANLGDRVLEWSAMQTEHVELWCGQMEAEEHVLLEHD
jgi:hypothetical protein